MQHECGIRVNELETRLGIEFNDPSLLQRAFIHKSYSYEVEGEIRYNERLEFLGDAVLDLVVSTYIFKKFPDHSEGDLARIRAGVVSEPMLARKARNLDLGSYLLLGRGERMTDAGGRTSILADTLEAVVGALYLDRGLALTRSFILGLLKKEIDDLENGATLQDYKTRLQEYTQKRKHKRPQYRVQREIGPDHKKEFLVEVTFDGRVLGQGQGRNKKEAQQEAAREALRKLGQLEGNENGRE